MADDSLPRSRKEAKALGVPRYFTGKPCKNGHTAERYTSGGCLVCVRASGIVYRHLPEIEDKRRKASRWRMAKRRADPVENAKIRQARSKHQKKSWKEARDRFFAGLAREPKPANCQVCNSDRRICLDHCHASGKFRGWICTRCNTILGWVQDDPKHLRKLAEYLEKNLEDRAVLPTYLRRHDGKGWA